MLGVTSFNNSVSGPVTAGTHLIFNCQAIAEDAHWIINGTTRLRSFSGFTIITNFIGGNFDHWNLTLSTTATLQYNNTVIECTARGTTSNQHDTRTAYIRIAGECSRSQLALLNKLASYSYSCSTGVQNHLLCRVQIFLPVQVLPFLLTHLWALNRMAASSL